MDQLIQVMPNKCFILRQQVLIGNLNQPVIVIVFFLNKQFSAIIKEKKKKKRKLCNCWRGKSINIHQKNDLELKFA